MKIAVSIHDFEVPGELNRLKRLVGCRMKSIQPILKTKMLIYRSEANLDVKSLFGKVTHLLDP